MRIYIILLIMMSSIIMVAAQDTCFNNLNIMMVLEQDNETLNMVKSETLVLTNLMNYSHDKVGLVSFSSDANLVLELTMNQTLISNRIGLLEASNGTNIGEGVKLANLEMNNNSRENSTKVILIFSNHSSNNWGNPSIACNNYNLSSTNCTDYELNKVQEAKNSGIDVLYVKATNQAVLLANDSLQLNASQIKLALNNLSKTTCSCGNGILETSLGEVCDDGNSISLDGCDNSCQVEADIKLTKLAGTANDGEVLITKENSVIYTYIVENIGKTALNNIYIIDDNGTAELIDDYLFDKNTVSELANLTLLPGQSISFTKNLKVYQDKTNIAVVFATPSYDNGSDIINANAVSKQDDAQVKMFNQVSDAKISNALPRSNFGKVKYMMVNPKESAVDRSYIRIDSSDLIGQNLAKADLELLVHYTGENVVGNSVDAYYCKTDFTENTIIWNTQKNLANCKLVDTYLITNRVVNNEPKIWHTFDLLNETNEELKSGDGIFTVILVSSQENTQVTDNKQFVQYFTKDHPNSEYRPKFVTVKAVNNGTNYICGNGIIEINEECDDSNNLSGDGCSIICKIETPQNLTYVISYLGDIDGAANSTWFYFYGNLTNFYHDLNVPVSISFFPGTMSSDETFKAEFSKMYLNENIELIQKSFMGTEEEANMYNQSYDVQKAIIKNGHDAYVSKMQEILGVQDIKPLVTYDQLLGKITNVTLQALKDLGYISYFDLYYHDDLGPVEPTETFDVIQYGVSFTISGGVGKETEFKNMSQVISEIKGFDRKDVTVMTINKSKVIPLYAHHQDFESKNQSGQIDMKKWNIYRETLQNLKNDPNVVFITPKQAYEMKRAVAEPVIEPTNGNITCQYAKSAVADSENMLGSFARYATGAPDTTIGTCEWSGYGHTWTPENWNIKATLNLTYDKPMYVTNMTVFGQDLMCWDRIWLKNSVTGEVNQIVNGPKNDCVLTETLNGGFLADSIILETCGWAWTATDAVQMCGKAIDVVVPKPTVEICTWKGCEKGAVSVSVDDSFTSCMAKLDTYGYRGTYFLSNTNNLSDETWSVFNDAFARGHELGTHTENHLCSVFDPDLYKQDMEQNIQDIVNHTDLTTDDIITHNYPCGATTPDIEEVIMNNWNFLSARGYNFNTLEEPTPVDFFNLKNLNSHYYPGGDFEPPNYLTSVDLAQEQGKWANIVFHNACDDDGVIDYISGKEVWIDSIGNVVKYIRLRDSALVSDYTADANKISFTVSSELTENYYSQSLTLKVFVDVEPVTVEVNGDEVGFNYESGYIIFDIPFPIEAEVVISMP